MVEVFDYPAFCYAQENARQIKKLRANPVLDLVERMNKQLEVLEYRVKALEEKQCQEQ